MSIQRLPPELINLVAAQLDPPRDVLALERTRHGVRNAVQDTKPSSPWGQVFHAELQRLTPKQVTVSLVPPQNYRDAGRALLLKHKLNGELTRIRQHPSFEQISLQGPALGRLKLPYHQFREQALDGAYARNVVRHQLEFGHSVSGMLPWIEAQSRCEIYDAMGQDPSRVLAFLMLEKTKMAPLA